MTGAVWKVALLWMAVQPGALPPRAAEPLLQAHAHNDYLHSRPLWDALDHGFTSVEADVFLVGDKLCVAHEPNAIRPERTLQSLYLEPLRQRVQANGGHVYRAGSRFLLLIDLKTAAQPTYQKLHDVLAQYRDILTHFEPQGRRGGPITVIVSGNRPLDLMRSQPVRYAGCDGRVTDLDADAPAALLPMLSDLWGKHFTWRGEGAIPAEERQKLRGIVERAHAKGRLVRFCATPDARTAAREAVWRELIAAGVDLVNTDDLQGLQEFLLTHGR
jgi:hypothetical protein